ncbi:MAG: TorF family putative porin [Opitutaceae bacterium]
MKKIASLLAALVAGASLQAQMETPKSSYSVTTDFTYTSKYVFRGVQRARDSFQPSVDVTVGDFYVNLWTNQPIIRHEDDEIDLSAGYRYKVTNALKLEAMGTYYWYPEAKGGSTRDAFEMGVGAIYDIAGVTSRIAYNYDFIRKANILEGSVGSSMPLPAIGSSLDVTVYAGTSKADDAAPDSGVTVRESYNYYGVDLRVPYQLSQNTKLSVGGHWANNENYILGTPRNRFWFDVGVSAGF